MWLCCHFSVHNVSIHKMQWVCIILAVETDKQSTIFFLWEMKRETLEEKLIGGG